MSRRILWIALALAFFPVRFLQADDGPPISITSPDKGTTFAYGSIKNHTLIWSKKYKTLVARITFTDAEFNNGQPNDDTHEFRLPGVAYDETKGLFFATSAKGEIIPVAQVKKAFLFKTIETLPNANVRIQRMSGNVTVILEAISPNDPALHAPPSSTNPDETQKVDTNKIL